MRCDLLGPERAADRRRRLRRVLVAGLFLASVIALVGATIRFTGGAGGLAALASAWGVADWGFAAQDSAAADGDLAGGRAAATDEASSSVPAGVGTSASESAESASDGGADAAGESGANDGARSAGGPVVRTRPLSAWLTDVAADAGLDLVLSPDLRGDLTATDHSGRLDWRGRLAAYARVAGFEFEVAEGLIEVRRLGSTSAVSASAGAEADASSGASSGAAHGVGARPGRGRGEARAAAASSPPEPPAETRVITLAHAAAKELAAVVAKAGEALGVVVAPDPSGNTVVLSGPRVGIERTARLLAELDRPRRRVLLEARIVEVAESARLDLGVEWKLSGDVGAEVKFPPPLSEAGNAALLVATGGSPSLDARVAAMEAEGRLRVVSRPSVVMIEGSPATIESVRILRIRLPSRGAVVGTDVIEAPTNDRATQDIPVGVRLEVTPSVRAGSRVLLRIRAKSSSLGAPLPPDDIPEELSRMVDAEVLVGSGETVVLGGLTRETGTHSDSGVPGVRRVPLLGGLFGKKTTAREDEELVILVTPRILD